MLSPSPSTSSYNPKTNQWPGLEGSARWDVSRRPGGPAGPEVPEGQPRPLPTLGCRRYGGGRGGGRTTSEPSEQSAVRAGRGKEKREKGETPSASARPRASRVSPSPGALGTSASLGGRLGAWLRRRVAAVEGGGPAPARSLLPLTASGRRVGDVTEGRDFLLRAPQGPATLATPLRLEGPWAAG